MRAAALAALVALAGGGAGWELDEFLVYMGWPGEVECPDDEALARAMSEAGINTVMWDLPKLELCRKYGLRLSVYHGEVVSEEIVSEEQLAELRASPAWPKGVPPLTFLGRFSDHCWPLQAGRCGPARRRSSPGRRASAA